MVVIYEKTKDISDTCAYVYFFPTKQIWNFSVLDKYAFFSVQRCEGGCNWQSQVVQQPLSFTVSAWVWPYRICCPCSSPLSQKRSPNKNKTMVFVLPSFPKRDLRVDDRMSQHKGLVFTGWVTLICFALKHT